MNWCTNGGIPKLLDENALLKTQLMPTDDDAQFHGSFQEALSRHKSKYSKMVSTFPENGTS